MFHTVSTLRVALLPVLEESSRLGGTEGPDLTRYFAVCGTLLAVIGLLAWGFRRLLAGNLRTRAAKRSLRVLDVLPLGGKRRLAVVRCYDRTFVLGLGDHEITPITELDPVIGADQPGLPPSKPGGAAFAEALEQLRPALHSPRLARPAPAEKNPPVLVVRKKVRRKKGKAPAAASAAIDPNSETVAQVARRMARERRGGDPAPRAPLPARTPAPVKGPVQRLEGVLG